MINHHQQLWYREQKLQSPLRSPAFIRADLLCLATEAASKAATITTGGRDQLSCSWGIGRDRVVAHSNIYGEYDWLLGCLQIRDINAIANSDGVGNGNGNGNGDGNGDINGTGIMSSERKPPLMLLSQDETHSVISDFSVITLSNSENDLLFVWVVSAGLEDQMPDILEVEI